MPLRISDAPGSPLVSPIPGVDTFVDRKLVLRALCTSNSGLYEKIRAGEFPPPIKDGRKSLWLLSQVQAYIATLVAQASTGDVAR